MLPTSQHITLQKRGSVIKLDWMVVSFDLFISAIDCYVCDWIHLLCVRFQTYKSSSKISNHQLWLKRSFEQVFHHHWIMNSLLCLCILAAAVQVSLAKGKLVSEIVSNSMHIPQHIRSSLNVKHFKAQCLLFYSNFIWIILSLNFWFSLCRLILKKPFKKIGDLCQ